MQDSRLFDSFYLTPEEAARYMKVSGRTFRARVREYKIPRYSPARNRYRVEDLDAFMRDEWHFLGKRDKEIFPHEYKPISVV